MPQLVSKAGEAMGSMLSGSSFRKYSCCDGTRWTLPYNALFVGDGTDASLAIIVVLECAVVVTTLVGEEVDVAKI